MKKKKKNLIIIVSILILLIIGSILFIFKFDFRNKNALTLEENKWIDTNKHDVIDIALINDVPILSYDGSGLVYNFFDDVTDDLSLKFNVVSYKLDGTSEYSYKMDIVSNPSNNDIVLLKDNMILITKSNTQYKTVDQIDALRIGVLAQDKTILTNYFSGKNIQFVEYSSYAELKNSLVVQDTTIEQDPNIATESVDGIIILKTVFTKEMIENNYNVSFEFNDLNKYFVLSINGNNVLKSILSKRFNNWIEDDYEESYNESLLSNYFEFKNISDVEEKTLKSKSYTYGFIDYGFYNYLDNDKISGLSGLILKDFNRFSGLSITYTRYNSISTLLKDFNSNKVDFMLNIVDKSKYVSSIYETTGVFNKDLVIISGIDNVYVIDNLNSLNGKDVLTVKDSHLETLLISKGIKVKSYNNFEDLAKDFKSKDIAVVDLENYNYYKTSAFKDSKINYLINSTEKYNYVINDIQENSLFKDLFNFYVSYDSTNELVATNYSDIAYENTNIVYILVVIIIILVMYLVLDFSNHIKVMMKTVKKNKKVHLSKEDKLKYIDQLTSLKNRAYLNSKIESWDDSEVYPQSIIIIDLNNISYINDNYGREEGDKVITEAANILIQHQLQNSEIIRTDGNEFLIYLVGYNEKQIISYLRKLNKELKNLSHGFGAASGYSIIMDAIKTVDDAVNEATLDMKNNKEDIEY